MNPAQAEAVASWRAGVENANTVVAHHDYIPSAGAPAYLQPDNLVGQVAPDSFNGLKIQGSYGNLWVVQSDFIPEDYVIVAATEGPNSPNNAIGVRQHTNPVYQGLRIIPGRVPGYPLQEAFFQRSFGVGVRHRGAAAVVQIKASGSYDVPSVAK